MKKRTKKRNLRGLFGEPGGRDETLTNELVDMSHDMYSDAVDAYWVSDKRKEQNDPSWCVPLREAKASFERRLRAADAKMDSFVEKHRGLPKYAMYHYNEARKVAAELADRMSESGCGTTKAVSARTTSSAVRAASKSARKATTKKKPAAKKTVCRLVRKKVGGRMKSVRVCTARPKRKLAKRRVKR